MIRPEWIEAAAKIVHEMTDGHYAWDDPNQFGDVPHLMESGREGYRVVARAAITALLSAAKADGWQMMPREVDDAMWNAGDDLMPSVEQVEEGLIETDIFYEVIPGPGKIWRAMFDAQAQEKAP